LKLTQRLPILRCWRLPALNELQRIQFSKSQIADAVPRSRGAIRPGSAKKIPCPPQKRAQGKPDARCTRGLVCKIVQKHAHEHTGPAEAIRLSLRNGFNGLWRALPGDRACLTPSPREYGFVRPVGLAKPPRDLTPTAEASGPHAFAVHRRAVRLRAS